MKKSLAKSSIFYLLYTVCNMLFPFVTSLYVARILLPMNIGEVAYAQNIVNYFAILAFLGLPTYGIREIAVARQDKYELSKVYSELFTINFISTIVFSVLYYGLVFISPSFRENQVLYSIVGLTVILNMFNISWLYEGVEEFGYVSLRNAAFKVLMLVLVIIFVRNDNDIIPYAAITVFGTAGNGIINVIHARKFVQFTIRDLDLKRHLKSTFILVMVNLAIEIYTMIDTTMLGHMLTKDHVAFYSYATKVNRMLLQVTNTFTIVLVPRISLHYKEGNTSEFNRLLSQGLILIVFFALPMIIGMQFTAGFLFPNLFGTQYIASAKVEQILSLLILISPIGYLLGSRVMLVTNNEKKMVVCVSIGAIVNVILNYLLIPILYESGAAIASVIGEIIIMMIYIHFARKVYKLENYWNSIFKVMVSCIPVQIIQFVYVNIQGKNWLVFGIDVLLSLILYLITLIILKERICVKYLRLTIDKINRRRDNGQ